MPIDPIAPHATAPADRLTLSASEVRGADVAAPIPGVPGSCMCPCFADEA